MPWAEVIGDPIAHSRSPAIHTAWLSALGIAGTYRAMHVPSSRLENYFADRRADLDWRGCNVTAPHKTTVIPFLDRLSEEAERIGAVNCVVREGSGRMGALIGHNTDTDGIDHALVGVVVASRKVVLIGAGGAARAAMAWLSTGGVREVVCLARDSAKAGRALPDAVVRPMNGAALEGAGLIINASPLGMGHSCAMPHALLAGLAAVAPQATAFDMIYQPADTLFLQAARASGLTTISGFDMLVGQARSSFRAFFGTTPPGIPTSLLCESPFYDRFSTGE